MTLTSNSTELYHRDTVSPGRNRPVNNIVIDLLAAQSVGVVNSSTNSVFFLVSIGK